MHDDISLYAFRAAECRGIGALLEEAPERARIIFFESRVVDLDAYAVKGPHDGVAVSLEAGVETRLIVKPLGKK